jgi:thioredoxin-like negative regulator of GroEL
VTERVLLLVAVVVVMAVVLVVGRALVRRRTADRLGRELPAGIEVGQPGAPTVLYFYGPACAACASQKEALETLPSGRVNVVPVDAAREHELASWAGVMTIPSTAIVDPARRLRAVNHGFRPAAELSEQLAAIA